MRKHVPFRERGLFCSVYCAHLNDSVYLHGGIEMLMFQYVFHRLRSSADSVRYKRSVVY